MVSAYKKENLRNYRPISLLPVTGKIFEIILYNDMYEFFAENNLISPNQSGFKPGDSCINQLLSSIHDHQGLLHKLKQNGILGKMVDIITDFSNFRKQRVFLNGQYSP